MSAGARAEDRRAGHPGARRRTAHAGSPDFEQLVTRLDQRLEDLSRDLLERLRGEHPTPLGPPTVKLGRLARDGIRIELADFRHGTMPAVLPEAEALESCVLADSAEFDLSVARYRLTQRVLWEAWLELVEGMVSSAPERSELLKRGSEFFFAYGALLSDHLADLYRREIERSQNGEGQRLQAVRSVLAGKQPTNLSFDLDQHHLGVLAWGDAPPDAVRELAGLLERPPLMAGPLNGTWWAWISGSRPFDRDDEQVIGRFEPAVASRIALGRAGYGEAGFRATHRQAQRARWAARLGDQAVIRYADVAVELLASENEEEARRFIARELRSMEDNSPESSQNRRTLRAYFDCEDNAASAAARLGVHPHTIANRLRTIEDRIGHPIGARRLELELALRLRSCLDADDEAF